MNSRLPRIELRCSRCRASQWLDQLELLARLQAAGMLRREQEPDWEVAVQLLRSRVEQFPCPACSAAAMQVVTEADSRNDDWDDARSCVRCGKLISVERLQVFPDSRLCAACQQKSELGDTGDAPEFCSHCGAVLVLRTNRRGLSRYVLRCPECGRS